LARGIDTFAHKGALEGGGRTFAVCGCGLDYVYPSENKQLMIDVANNGAAFSEFAPTVHPEAWHFPARNRIISGLSAGTVVVEAAERSGALITSDFAMEQGREVFAVPGNVHKTQSRGCHALIKQGATLIENAEDVIHALNSRALPFMEESPDRLHAPVAESTPTVRDDLSAEQNKVWLALDVEPRHVDELAAETQMGAAQINATLVLFELKGLAKRLPGNVFARVES
jgi:DNA processing protein